MNNSLLAKILLMVLFFVVSSGRSLAVDSSHGGGASPSSGEYHEHPVAENESQSESIQSAEVTAEDIFNHWSIPACHNYGGVFSQQWGVSGFAQRSCQFQAEYYFEGKSDQINGYSTTCYNLVDRDCKEKSILHADWSRRLGANTPLALKEYADQVPDNMERNDEHPCLNIGTFFHRNWIVSEEAKTYCQIETDALLKDTNNRRLSTFYYSLCVHEDELYCKGEPR